MPESPEVDALAGFLGEQAVGLEIVATDLAELRALKTPERPLGELEGTTVRDVRRHGKHIAMHTSGPVLAVGLGRAGWIRWLHAGDEEPDPGRAPEVARIELADGSRLVLTDAGAWLSLGLSVVDEAREVPAIAKLGPDPLSTGFAAADLDRVLVGRRKQLKALLQEQESLAGIGNAYSDEILHLARLSPLEHASRLDATERARLFAAMRTELSDAFAARRGIPPDRMKAAKVAAMRVHGRSGQACPACGDLVRDVPGSKGGTQYCATCQSGGTPLEG